MKTKLFLVFIVVPFLVSCAFFQPNIPWEDRWASSYCVTTDWTELNILPAEVSVLCNLSEKYQMTLNEAQGLVFFTAIMISLPDPEKTVPVIGEYVTTLKNFVAQSPGLSLADLFLKVRMDSANPRYRLIKNMLNLGLMNTWGADPMAKWILGEKDVYFLTAHLGNVLYQIGYQPKI
jgi:hypothetical protein